MGFYEVPLERVVGSGVYDLGCCDGVSRLCRVLQGFRVLVHFKGSVMV